MTPPYNRFQSLHAKLPFIFRFSLKKLENYPLLLGKLMILLKGWLLPDAIIMPVAQLWEKAVFSVHHPPLLGFRELF